MHDSKRRVPPNTNGRGHEHLNVIFESHESLSPFLPTIAHELSQPLTVCRGTLELVLLKGRGLANYRAACERALTGVERLVTIVQLLQDLADVSGPPGRKAPFEMTALVREAMDDLSHMAENRRVALSLDASTQAFAHGDRDRSFQAVLMLLRSAVQQSSEHGLVHVSVSSSNETISLTIDHEMQSPENAAHPDAPGTAAVSHDSSLVFRPDEWALLAPRVALEATRGSVSIERATKQNSRIRLSLPRALRNDSPGPIGRD